MFIITTINYAYQDIYPTCTCNLYAYKSYLHILKSSHNLYCTIPYIYTHSYTHIGGDSLDNLLYCSVEKNDCVHVPGKEQTGWNIDKLSDLPTKPSKTFNMMSLQGMYICMYFYIYSYIHILIYIYIYSYLYIHLTVLPCTTPYTTTIYIYIHIHICISLNNMTMCTCTYIHAHVSDLKFLPLTY